MAMLRGVAYCRYSSDNQREESITGQIRAIKVFALQKNIEIIKIYADEAKSATTDQRPEFLKMMEDAELGQFKTIIVHKLDRFSRDRYDSAFYRRHLKKQGVKLFSVLENLDDSPESVILESILEGMAEYYSKNLAREVMKGLKENAYQCKHTGGIPPLGYNVGLDMKYEINENEADIIRMIFNEHLLGSGYLTIVSKLNSLGYTTKAGKAFKTNSIRDILKNEKYTGVYIFNRRAAGKKGNYVNKDPQEIIRIEGGMPQIIESNLFYLINNKMDLKRYGKRKSAKQNYLLSGMMKCGICGASYTGQSYVKGRGGVKYYLYGCTAKYNSKSCNNKDIRQDAVENFVVELIQNSMFNPRTINDFGDSVVNLYNENTKSYSADISKLEKEIEKTNLKLNRLLDLYLDEQLDQKSYTEKTKELKDLQELLTYQYSVKISTVGVTITKDTVVKHLEKLKTNLIGDNFEKKKNVIGTVIKQITVDMNAVRVELITDGLDGGIVLSGSSPPLLPLSISIKRSVLFKK